MSYGLRSSSFRKTKSRMKVSEQGWDSLRVNFVRTFRYRLHKESVFHKSRVVGLHHRHLRSLNSFPFRASTGQETIIIDEANYK